MAVSRTASFSERTADPCPDDDHDDDDATTPAGG